MKKDKDEITYTSNEIKIIELKMEIADYYFTFNNNYTIIISSSR